jgi:hypothetical protein
MPRPPRRHTRLTAEHLEDRVNPVSFSTTGDYWVGSNVLAVAVGDINGDGKPDIVAGTAGSGADILLNDGTGKFTDAGKVPMGPFHTKLVDLDNDGKLDILASNNYGQQVIVARGNGNGTFQTPVARSVGTTVQGLDVADFNGDGKPDVVASIPPGAVVLLNDGSANIFGSPTFYYPNPVSDSAGVTTGDFNGDGKPDFAVGAYSSNRVDVYINRGDGSFGAPAQYPNPVPYHSTGILTGDFTSDGKLDLIVGFASAAQLGLLRGNGDGTFQPVTFIDAPPGDVGPTAAADFDLDGNLDLAVMQGGKVAVLPGDGTGGFGPSVRVISAWPGHSAVGDVNADGLPDIVTGHALSPGLV